MWPKQYTVNFLPEDEEEDWHAPIGVPSAESHHCCPQGPRADVFMVSTVMCYCDKANRMVIDASTFHHLA